jgi:hypothetical protein
MYSKVNLTEDGWNSKLKRWLTPQSSLSGSRSYKAINSALNQISKVKSEKRRIRLIQLLSLVNLGKHLVFRYSSQGKFATKLSPPIGLFDDFRITDKHGLLSSRRIGITTFVKGSINSMSTGIARKFENFENDDFVEFLKSSPDFLTDGSKLINFEFYKRAPIVEFEGGKVKINGKSILTSKIEALDLDQKIAIYQAIIIQQYISHLGYGHLIPSYLYNLFKEL